MSIDTAETVAGLLGLYFGIGAIFALLFVTLALSRVDPAARGASWGTRLVLLPGAAGLWPLMALKWLITFFRKPSGVDS